MLHHSRCENPPKGEFNLIVVPDLSYGRALLVTDGVKWPELD